ncbi:MAG: hypothetical protein HQ500_08515 [Flavobacteriales bacterium]|nr:hypothetical protein [Flavobacteriales bacterium]
MTDLNKAITIIRWAARICSALILIFLLFFLIAHLFGEEESGEGFRNTQELATFLFFPISTVIGLSLGLKWEGLGGMITLLGMIGLLTLRPDLLYSVLILIPAIPGLLYVLYWGMRTKYPNNANQHSPDAPSID